LILLIRKEFFICHRFFTYPRDSSHVTDSSHIPETLHISQGFFTYGKNSSHVTDSSHIPETLHISQGFFTYGNNSSHVTDASRITGRPIFPFQYQWPQPPFQWVPGKGGQSLKRNIQLYIAPRSTKRMIVLSHSDVALWQGNCCLSCASLSMRRCYLHTFLTLALNVCKWPASRPDRFTARKDPRYTFDRMQSAPQSHLYLYLLQFSNVIGVSFVRSSHKPCCPTSHLFDMMKRQVQFPITGRTNTIRDEVLLTTGTALTCRPVGHFLLLGTYSETERRLAS